MWRLALWHAQPVTSLRNSFAIIHRPQAPCGLQGSSTQRPSYETANTIFSTGREGGAEMAIACLQHTPKHKASCDQTAAGTESIGVGH